ncbi:hypothetical protein [Pedobacter mucosus]|uniref:hypothetical protein n=1 Tax=Pedobacter mucosus TaxID=2895286 RepID=UPI001EE482AC|nr:hypothetical protein [Pedobacter mucosus]UKT63548.1 hypothetical protein LOK61_17485 [Pedobacter mucosus]
MKAFRILLAFAVAGATFYSLNVFAIKNGYSDRLDFKNKHYHEEDCSHEHFRNHGFSHHSRKLVEPSITPIDSTNIKQIN